MGEDGPVTVWAVAAGVLVIVLLGVFAVLVLGRQLRLRRYRRDPLGALRLLSRRRPPTG
jgi:hypothetical protein